MKKPQTMPTLKQQIRLALESAPADARDLRRGLTHALRAIERQSKQSLDKPEQTC